ncbi:ROK family protein [Motilibacter aurantiacus]|uniref:ROK family protein n=1 Tax=Motilibacter aurantiacus TaxID=2714955 RepID=UPI00140CED54|nr:ROK family protein [Motilibacter aurantiacus]NHC45855.1 ROK family protein [Motilibacter aurantiacus]
MRPATDVQCKILRLLRDEGPASRAALVGLVGVGRARLGVELEELLASGLIEESGLSVSRGGRPSPQVSLNSGLRFLAVDLGATSVSVAIGDSRLNLLTFLEEPCDIRSGPDGVLPHVHDLIAKAQATVGCDTISGIGIGVPGPVSFREGIPVSPPLMPGWNRYPLRDEFSRRFRCSVTVDNDVNMMAQGERWGGVAKGMDDFLFVKIGTGVGSAAVIHGDVYRGAAGCAGDIGHIRAGEGHVCACGNTGCLETMFSGAALSRDATMAATSGESPALAARLAHTQTLTALDVGEAAQEGDAVALSLIKTGGQRLGTVLAELVNFMNPSLVVIAGGISRLGHPLLAEIRQTVYRQSMPLATSNLPIVLSELGETGGVLGGLVTASDWMFSPSA